MDDVRLNKDILEGLYIRKGSSDQHKLHVEKQFDLFQSCSK